MKRTTTKFFVELPNEILEMVLLRLDSILDVVSFSLTSSKWYHLVHSTSFWSACGKRFILFRSCFGQVLWRYLVPSSRWKKTKVDIAEMFNLPFEKGDAQIGMRDTQIGVKDTQIGVKSSNNMLCIFQSLTELYIVNPMDINLEKHLISRIDFPRIPRNSKRKLFFYFDSFSNNYTVLIALSTIESYVHKKLNFIELESNETKTLMNEFSTFFLFENEKKLMLLRASVVLLQVWSIHEEKDEYILKLHSTFELDEEHKGCEIVSTSDLVILQFSNPSSALAYCPSTSEWQWIDDLHNELGFGKPSYYALDMSKAFPNKLTKMARG